MRILQKEEEREDLKKYSWSLWVPFTVFENHNSLGEIHFEASVLATVKRANSGRKGTVYHF